jgi:DNA polymerase-3 subunit gamma/tau
VVILDEAHMLTGEASNALLKTLEEPPDRVIFVMATTQPEDLVDTIRSRSQHFHFRALTFAEIAGRLEEIAKKENLKIEQGAMAVIARMAEGSLRDALSLLEQARAYCGDTIPDKEVRELLGVVPDDALEELVGAIAEGSADRALGLVHTFQKEGRNLQHFCREAIRHMRNLLIARTCGADSDLIAATPDQRPALAKAAALFSEEDLTRFFQILLQTDDDLRRKPDPRVHLEMGLLRLINAARLAPLEELLAELKSGAPGSVANSGMARGVSPAVASTSFTKSAAPSVVNAVSTQPKPETKADFSSTFATQAPAPATAGAPAEATQAVEANDSVPVKSDGVPVQAIGISQEHVAEIKAAIHAAQKFLGQSVEKSSRWELDGAELRIYFSENHRTFADWLGRESLEKIRAISSNVLGRAVRVCAKLETVAAAAAASGVRGPSGTQELRAQFERDPMVRSMLRRFGGKISEVKRSQEES